MTPPRKHQKPRTAAIYLRISKDRTGEELGVERQKQDCIALAESLGWQVVAVHSDNDMTAYSGKARPGFKALLQDIETGRADAVIAWHADRLYRHPRDLETFVETCERTGALVRTVTAGELDLSTDAGRMVARILGAVARQEVERSTSRIRRSKVQAAEQGRYRGGPRPFGYEADGMTVRPDEAAVVAEMTQRIAAGGSLNSITRDLNARGVTTSGGKPWASVEIRRTVLRARNIGRIELGIADKASSTLGGQAQWPAIVDEALWQQARDVLLDPDRDSRRGHQELRHLLTGVALCGVCLANGEQVKVRPGSSRTRGKGYVSAYTCSKAKHMTRVANLTDEYVAAVMTAWLARPEASEVLSTDPGADPVAVMAEVERVRTRVEEARLLWTDGILDTEQFRASVDRLRAQERDLLATLGRDSEQVLTADMIRAGWAALDIAAQRKILRRFASVVLLPSPKGRPAGWQPGTPYFRTETVQITFGAAAA